MLARRWLLRLVGTEITLPPNRIGFIWAGTTEQETGFEKTPSKLGRDVILASMRRILPGIEVNSLVIQTACLRPMSDDGYVIVGGVKSIDGLYLCGGTGRKGILYGPGMGKLVAALAMGTKPEIDVAPYLPTRF